MGSVREKLVGADGFWQAQSAPALGGHGSASEGLRLVTLRCEVSGEVEIKFYVSGKRCVKRTMLEFRSWLSG